MTKDQRTQLIHLGEAAGLAAVNVVLASLGDYGWPAGLVSAVLIVGRLAQAFLTNAQKGA